MRRRTLLLAGGVAALPLAGAELLLRQDADAREQAQQGQLEVHTDTGPMQRLLPGLGRIVAAHWVEQAPANRLGPGDVDRYAFLRLERGRVKQLTEGRVLTPVTLPPVGSPGARAFAEVGRIPAALGEFAPPGAQWAGCEALDAVLVRPQTPLCFDLASDTVYLHGINLREPAA